MIKSIDKKSALITALGYVIWGLQPLYWALMARWDPMFNLAMRVVWAAVFTVGILFFSKRLPELRALFKDKRRMLLLAPATLFLLGDWGLFIFAVQSGNVLDTSLGYFLAPFAVFAVSKFFFKEKLRPLVVVAMGLAFVGVAISAISYGRLPVVSLLLSFLFTVYGSLKKMADVDSTVSIAAETIMLTPLSLAFMLIFRSGADGLGSLTPLNILLLAGAGVVTALPMMLYSLGVIKLPFVMLGFMQYISPTLSLFCGLAMGETLTPDRLVTFVFLWAALALYLISLIIDERKNKKAAESAPPQPDLL